MYYAELQWISYLTVVTGETITNNQSRFGTSFTRTLRGGHAVFLY